MHFLVAEDQVEWRDIIAKVLQKLGHTFDIVTNGKEALDQLIRSPAGTYRGVITDNRMSIVHGIDVLRRIRTDTDFATFANMPVIVHSGDTDQEFLDEVVALGGLPASKDPRKGDLQRLINELAGKI